MQISSFQFSNPVLKHLCFKLNEGFSKSGKLDMDIRLNVSCKRNESENSTLNNSAMVVVCLTLGAEDDSTPFYIEATEEASFKWDESITDEKQIDTLLNQNAVALLISYLRPIIANVTASSPYPAYNLPYINLTTKE